MSVQKWILNSAGYLELIDTKTGEILEREKKRIIPKKLRSGSRGFGRPSKMEIALKAKFSGDTARKRLWPYNRMVAERIINAICSGERLTQLDLSKGFPPYAEILRWRRDNPEFNFEITSAFIIRAFHFEDMIIRLIKDIEEQPERVVFLRLKFNILYKLLNYANPNRYSIK